MAAKSKAIGARPLSSTSDAAKQREEFLQWQEFKAWQASLDAIEAKGGMLIDPTDGKLDGIDYSDDTTDDDDNSAASQYIAQASAMLPNNSPDKAPTLDDTTTTGQHERQAERLQSVANGNAASARCAQEIAGISRNIGKGSGPSSILVRGDAVPYVAGTTPKLAHCPQHDESKSKVSIPERQKDGSTKYVSKPCNLHDITNAVVRPLLASVPVYRLAVLNDDGSIGEVCAELVLGANKGDTMMLVGDFSIRLPVEDETGKGFVVFNQRANVLAQSFMRTSRNVKQAKQTNGKASK